MYNEIKNITLNLLNPLKTERLKTYKIMMEMEMKKNDICENKLYDIFFINIKKELKKQILIFMNLNKLIIDKNEIVIDIDNLLKDSLDLPKNKSGPFMEMMKEFINNKIEVSDIFYNNMGVVFLILILCLNKYDKNSLIIKETILNYLKFDKTTKLLFLYGTLKFVYDLMSLKNENILTNYLNINNEINKIIPDSLGSMKTFYVTIITQYYSNLRPIIWLHILEKLALEITEIFPLTIENVYKYIASKILLNSGPFMLKILQLVTPFMTQELAEKYNVKKLTYPLMSKDEVDLLLKPIVINYENYEITRNISASVGHVCFVKNKETNETFVIKIIKPLSILQACAEHDILSNMFDKIKNKCEYDYVNGILESNGIEMNVLHETKNINICSKLYNLNYTFLNANVNVKLTTIKNIKGIMNKENRYALAMTMATGKSINELLESGLLNNNNKFQSLVHRCFDLLVYSFFQNILLSGYYHGDLHGGNMIYNSEINTLTLIDFGAVSKLDLNTKNGDIKNILKILILGTFENYDDLLDELTDYVNSKCDNSYLLDKNKKEYNDFKKKMYDYKINNAINYSKNKKNINEYKKYLMNERIIIEAKTNINDEINESYIKQTSTNKNFVDVLNEIMEFYAKMNVNIIIKLGNYYEFQKAYMLLYGVAMKINYDNDRFTMMIQKSMMHKKLLKKNLGLMGIVIKYYTQEKNKYNKLLNKIKNIKI